jgi:hypothetical protein
MPVLWDPTTNATPTHPATMDSHASKDGALSQNWPNNSKNHPHRMPLEEKQNDRVKEKKYSFNINNLPNRNIFMCAISSLSL